MMLRLRTPAPRQGREMSGGPVGRFDDIAIIVGHVPEPGGTVTRASPVITFVFLFVVIVCHDWQNIRYCDGPNGYRTEEHETGGMTYGRDTSGNSWESHVYNGKEYTNTWRNK